MPNKEAEKKFRDKLHFLEGKLESVNHEIKETAGKQDFDSLLYLGALYQQQEELSEQIEKLKLSEEQAETNNLMVRVKIKLGKAVKSFVIVDEIMVDPSSNLVSKKSPIARAVNGKKAGDRFQFATPNGVKNGVVLELA